MRTGYFKLALLPPLVLFYLLDGEPLGWVDAENRFQQRSGVG